MAKSYSMAGAADEIGVSVDVIRRAVKAGDLPSIYPKVNGRAISKPLIRAADLDAWLDAASVERAS